MAKATHTATRHIIKAIIADAQEWGKVFVEKYQKEIIASLASHRIILCEQYWFCFSS